MSDSEGFTIPVTLTADDYARYFESLGRRQQDDDNVLYWAALAASVPVALVLGQWAWDLTRQDSWAVGLLCLVAYGLGLGAALLAGTMAQRRHLRRYVPDAQRNWAYEVIKIAADGVACSGKSLSIHVAWAGITAVTAEAGAVLIWAGKTNAVRIPDRAFASPAERQAVVDYARSKLAS